jgi:hypothetical protein
VASFGGCKGRWGRAWFSAHPARGGSSPRRLRWRARVERGGAAGRDAGGSAPFMGDQRSTATSLGARTGHYSTVRRTSSGSVLTQGRAATDRAKRCSTAARRSRHLGAGAVLERCEGGPREGANRHGRLGRVRRARGRGPARRGVVRRDAARSGATLPKMCRCACVRMRFSQNF